MSAKLSKQVKNKILLAFEHADMKFDEGEYFEDVVEESYNLKIVLTPEYKTAKSYINAVKNYRNKILKFILEENNFNPDLKFVVTAAYVPESTLTVFQLIFVGVDINPAEELSYWDDNRERLESDLTKWYDYAVLTLRYTEENRRELDREIQKMINLKMKGMDSEVETIREERTNLLLSYIGYKSEDIDG